jgi:hypothetical protein
MDAWHANVFALSGSGSRHALEQAEVACPISWTLNHWNYARVILWLDGVVIKVLFPAWRAMDASR